VDFLGFAAAPKITPEKVIHSFLQNCKNYLLTVMVKRVIFVLALNK
jgi:hypothetical protein